MNDTTDDLDLFRFASAETSFGLLKNRDEAGRQKNRLFVDHVDGHVDLRRPFERVPDAALSLFESRGEAVANIGVRPLAVSVDQTIPPPSVSACFTCRMLAATRSITRCSNGLMRVGSSVSNSGSSRAGGVVIGLSIETPTLPDLPLKKGAKVCQRHSVQPVLLHRHRHGSLSQLANETL